MKLYSACQSQFQATSRNRNLNVVAKIKLWPLFAVFIFSLNLSAQTIYTWVDENGISHFSHHPITLPEIKTIEASQLSYINRSLPTTIPTTDPTTDPTTIPTTAPTVKNKAGQKHKIRKAGKTTTQKIARQCKHYREKMAKVERKLRQGYKEPKGNLYRQQRRNFSDLIFKYCKS